MESQCLGLAEILGVEPVIKRIQLRKPWCWLPPALMLAPLSALGSGGDKLMPPWPDLLISSGRLAVAPAIAVRRSSGGATFCVQLQDPTVSTSNFDLVATPTHDRLAGANVISTLGAMHGITPARLADEAKQTAQRLGGLPRPLVTVLLGGDNRAYRFTPAVAQALGRDLACLARNDGVGLAVTPSRRTGAHVLEALRSALEGLPVVIWDGTGNNPYFSFLAQADVLVVTGDSVNMVSEAAATGKPVFVVDLEGGSRKFSRFHENMRTAGITRRFTGQLDRWTYQRPDDTERVAAEIRHHMGLIS